MSEVEFKKFAVCDTCGASTMCREVGDDDQCGGCYWAPINKAEHESQLAALREELENRTDRVAELAQQRNDLQQRLADAERRNEARNAEIAAQVESALRRSFSLGQVYWQQADSDSTCQQNKSDQTTEVQAQHILNVLKSIDAALNKPEEAKS